MTAPGQSWTCQRPKPHAAMCDPNRGVDHLAGNRAYASRVRTGEPTRQGTAATREDPSGHRQGLDGWLRPHRTGSSQQAHRRVKYKLRHKVQSLPTTGSTPCQTALFPLSTLRAWSAKVCHDTTSLNSRVRALWNGRSDEDNPIYRLERLILEVALIVQVDGPVHYPTTHGNSMYFSTASKPGTSTARCSTLWMEHGDPSEEVLRSARVQWPSRLFQYGQVRFPGGPGHLAGMWVTPLAVIPDHRIHRLDATELSAAL